MSTIRPNTPCWIVSMTNSFDGHGQPVFKTKKRKTKCSIVSLHDASGKTTVRADSSASRGQADERLADGRLLLKPNEQVRLGDIVEVKTDRVSDIIKIQITRIFRRVDIAGKVHHIDVEGDIWVSG